MAEAAFSEDGKYFSAISQDGRLRIWDTETNVLKQEYTPDLHLSSPPSCIQWISVAQNTGPSKKGARRKSVSGEGETKCIAIGTRSGKILIYSVAQAKVETVLKDDTNSEIHSNNIQSLDWRRKYGLYSCNKEGYVHEWDLESGTVRNKYNVNVEIKKQASSISAIKIIPHNQKTPARFIATASTQVCLWRLHSGEAELVKCLGHNAAPRALLQLATCNNMCWLVEGAQTERLLSFWDLTITEEHMPSVNGEATPNKKKRRKSVSVAATVPTPTYNFVLEDAPKLLDVEVEEEGVVRLAAATRSGVVHYYRHMINGASTKPIKPSVTIQVTTPDATPLPLRCCRHRPGGDVLMGYTSGPAMMFERVTPDLSSKTQVLIRGDAKETKRRNKHTDTATRVTGEQSSDAAYLEPMGGVSRKRATPGGETEVAMEERLANLSVRDGAKAQGPAGHNLARLLVQGLRSQDKDILRTVLQCNKSSVALQTVRGLPPDCVPLLLQHLGELATRRTPQCAFACTWVTAVLRSHAALLLAAGGDSPAATHLTRLLASFTHRRSHLCQLLNLKGRLDLTLAQREARDKPLAEQEPVLQYNDTSSDEEMEVERYSSNSEMSWGARAGSAASGDISGDGGDSSADAGDSSGDEGDKMTNI